LKIVILIMTTSILLVPATVPAEHPEPEVHGTFDGDPMYTVLPPDAIPAIRDPEFVSGEAAAAQMSPDEHVMGLARDGDAVCWSTASWTAWTPSR